MAFHNTSAVDPEQALKAARRWKWTGAACFLSLAVLFVGSGLEEKRLRAMAGLPQDIFTLVIMVFFASWLVAGFGSLMYAGELQLEARASTPEQKAAVKRISLLRRLSALCLMAAVVVECLVPLSKHGAQMLRAPVGLVTAVLLGLMGLAWAGFFNFLHRAGKLTLEALPAPRGTTAASLRDECGFTTLRRRDDV